MIDNIRCVKNFSAQQHPVTQTMLHHLCQLVNRRPARGQKEPAL